MPQCRIFFKLVKNRDVPIRSHDGNWAQLCSLHPNQRSDIYYILILISVFYSVLYFKVIITDKYYTKSLLIMNRLVL